MAGEKTAEYSKDYVVEGTAGALIVAFTVTVDPGVPDKVPDVETVGIGKTSSSFWQLANATTTIANIASTLNMFVCKRFITFFVKMLIV
jgi:hypothetical protein